MLFDNYIIVNKKDLCIFTPFINIEYDLKKEFLDFIQNKQKKGQAKNFDLELQRNFPYQQRSSTKL